MAKKKIKVIDANQKNSETVKRIENFANRFNIDIPHNNRAVFQFRCVSAIAEYVGDSSSNICYISRKVFHLLGLPYSGEDEYRFSRSQLYDVLKHKNLSPSDDRSLYQWLIILECILNIKWQNDYGKSTFVIKIVESLKLSGINAILCDSEEGYLFYPANAELLDQKIIIDVLNWLSKYPLAKEQYNQALRMFLKGDRSRHVIDTIRLSFELFLKQYLDSNTSIENQVKALGQFLKEKNVSTELRNMYIKLVDYYAIYNNQHIKHNDDSENIMESEIEFLLYLTGNFIRYLIQLKSEE